MSIVIESQTIEDFSNIAQVIGMFFTLGMFYLGYKSLQEQIKTSEEQNNIFEEKKSQWKEQMEQTRNLWKEDMNQNRSLWITDIESHAKAINEQIDHARKLFEITIITKLEDKFESEKMIAKRRYAAEFLLTNPTIDDPRWDNISDLIDFFQVIGTITIKNEIDHELPYKWFYYWLSNYYIACKGYIEKARQSSPITWGDFVKLYEKLKQYDNECNEGKLSNFSKEEIEGFLKWELNSLKAHEDYYPGYPYGSTNQDNTQ
jgi:hypothetical protein